MDSPKYSKMCLCRCLIAFLLAPSLVYSAEWTGKWFPENPKLRLATVDVANATTTSNTTSDPSIATTASTAAPASSTAPPASSTAPPAPSTASPASSTASPAPTTDKILDLDIDHWTGKWFPGEPGSRATTPMPSTGVPSSEPSMGLPDAECDNAKDNLAIDFDPMNLTDSVIYVCLGKKHLYNPNMTVEPILREYDISPAYRPLHKCMETKIAYEPGIPTFGTHRPLWAKYGVYKYVPPQRWLHNLEHGAIVMLYHPCANFNQVEQLKMLVKNCLYRHIITPSSELLTPERPMALVAWGKSLEMSVVVPEIVIKFIKENALRGPEQIVANGQYEKLLINHADVVSTADDSVLCPNNPDVPVV